MRKFMIRRMWLMLAALALLFGVGFPRPAHAEICDPVSWKITFEDEGCRFGATCSGEGCVGRESGDLFIIDGECSCNSAA